MTKLHFGGSEENCEIVKIEAEYFDLQNDEFQPTSESSGLSNLASIQKDICR